MRPKLPALAVCPALLRLSLISHPGSGLPWMFCADGEARLTLERGEGGEGNKHTRQKPTSTQGRHNCLQKQTQQRKQEVSTTRRRQAHGSSKSVERHAVLIVEIAGWTFATRARPAQWFPHRAVHRGCTSLPRLAVVGTLTAGLDTECFEATPADQDEAKRSDADRPLMPTLCEPPAVLMARMSELRPDQHVCQCDAATREERPCWPCYKVLPTDRGCRRCEKTPAVSRWLSCGEMIGVAQGARPPRE